MSFNYRCSRKKCRARKTLKKPIEKYIRKPKCPSCGEDSLKLDPEPKRRHKLENCFCDGYPWSATNGPHRKGSRPWCVHSDREPTEEEYRERFGS